MITGIMLRLDSLKEYEKLNDQQFGSLIRAGLQFAIDGTEPELNEPESYLWPGFKLKINNDIDRYRRKCEQNTRNINKRWEQQSKPEKDTAVYDRIRTYTNDTNNNNKYNNNDNNKGNNTDTGISEGNPKASGGGQCVQRFKPPTVEEVRQYCRERNNTIDPEEFVDYYEARGWELKKGQKMKDWQASVRYWEKNQKGGQNGTQRTNRTAGVPWQRDLYE